MKRLQFDHHHPRTLNYRREALVTAALRYAEAETDAAHDEALKNLLAAASRWANPPPKSAERPVRYCVECRRYQPIAAKGLCAACYRRRRVSAAARVQAAASAGDAGPEATGNQSERIAA